MSGPKILVPVFLAIVAFPSGVESQALSVGGRLGLTNSGVLFEDESSRDRIDDMRGLQVSGVVGYELNSVLAIQIELSYVQKGWKEWNTGGGRRLSYLEIPVLLKVAVPWKVSPHIVVGPSLARELSCAVTDVPTVGSVSCSDSRVEWDRRKLQVGLWFGLGVGSRIGFGTVDLQFLGNLSATDMNQEALPRGYARLAAVMVSVSYRIPVGER